MLLIYSLLLSLTSGAHAATKLVPQLNAGKFGTDRGMHCPIDIMPGKSLGPIRLGATRKEIAALKLPTVGVRTLPQDELAARYEVFYDEQERVYQVILAAQHGQGCLRYRGQRLAQKKTIAELGKIFPGCGKEEARIGGQWMDCDGLTLSRGAWDGVQIRVVGPR